MYVRKDVYNKHCYIGVTYLVEVDIHALQLEVRGTGVPDRG
jgi:hypothetical protein